MYPIFLQDLKDDFLSCDSSEQRPVIVYISKMFSVEESILPKNKMQPLTEEDIARKRELARARHAERLAQMDTSASMLNCLFDCLKIVYLIYKMVKEDPLFKDIYKNLLRYLI